VPSDEGEDETDDDFGFLEEFDEPAPRTKRKPAPRTETPAPKSSATGSRRGGAESPANQASAKRKLAAPKTAGKPAQAAGANRRKPEGAHRQKPEAKQTAHPAKRPGGAAPPRRSAERPAPPRPEPEPAAPKASWIPDDAGYEVVGPAGGEVPVGRKQKSPGRLLVESALFAVVVLACLASGGFYLWHSGLLGGRSSGEPRPARPEAAGPEVAATSVPPGPAPLREGTSPVRGREAPPQPSEKPASLSTAGDVLEIGIAHNPEKRRWLEWAVEQYAAGERSPAVRVNLYPMEARAAAEAILGGDQRIHVWAPASKLHLEGFRRDWRAQRGKDAASNRNPIPTAEELALTPLVIVMWKGRFEAFTSKSPEVSLKTIGYAMHAKQGWGTIAGRPAWGHFKFAHTHPARSGSGLMGLALLAYRFYGKTSDLTVREVMQSDFQEYLASFASGVADTPESTGDLIKDAILRGPSVYDALLIDESTAIEYFEAAHGRWEDFQVAYPDCNVWRDNPYCVLDVPWTTEPHRRAARALLEFLLSEPIQRGALDHGFRPGNPSVSLTGPDSPFVRYEENGLRVDPPGMCDLPSRDVVENLQQSWTRITGKR
jgi:hypothetical protein